MKVELVNKNENKVLCTADILFGLDVLIVEKCDGMDTFKLQQLLEKRAELPVSYKTDEIVLEKLNLLYKRNCFGRMNEACVLYAMLCNFEKEDDDLALYPLHNEFVCMSVYDPNYTNLYIWRTRDAVNA